MSKKKIVLEFVFREEQDEEWTYLKLDKIKRTRCDLNRDELTSLGEDMAQSDRWQIDGWIQIQDLLSE